jgi:hypothetical protein
MSVFIAVIPKKGFPASPVATQGCAGFRLQTSGFRLQASGFRLQATGFRLQATGFRLQASGFRLQASGYRLQATGVTLIPIYIGIMLAEANMPQKQ